MCTKPYPNPALSVHSIRKPLDVGVALFDLLPCSLLVGSSLSLSLSFFFKFFLALPVSFHASVCTYG